jgi:hypothetical protein
MRTVSAYALKQTVAIALLGCLIAGGCGAVAALDYARPDDAKGQPTPALIVNRTNKGDQLTAAIATSTIRAKTSSSTTAASRNRPPFGCDAAFSSIADPIRAQIYKRCAA